MPHRSYRAPATVAPFEGASKLQTELAELIALMTDWTAAMNDTYDVSAVLDAAQRRADTRSITLYRITKGALRARLIARTTPAKGIDIQPLPSGNLAAFLLQRHEASAVPGSVWRLSELRHEPGFGDSAACREWLKRPDTMEVTLMILANAGGEMDVLELQFPRPPVRHDVIGAEMLATALTRTWAQRQDGLCQRLIVKQEQRHRSNAAMIDRNILASDNPFNLSRSEFRICALLGEGLRAKEIADELGLSLTTVRSHLRNVYAKTETSGQLEVVSRLHGAQAIPAVQTNIKRFAVAAR